MKCVRMKGQEKIDRVTDEKAAQLVASGQFVYAGKIEWKRQKQEVKK